MGKLKLTIKKKWFYMIATGEKTEEYRELKSYWVRRLLTDFNWDSSKNPIKLNRGSYNAKPFNPIQFFNGAYFSEALPNFNIECKGITIGKGRQEWGAEPGVNYFIIKLGEKQA